MSAYVKAAEEFLATLDKLIVEGKNHLSEKIFHMMKPPYSGNGCLKILLSIRSEVKPGAKAFKDRMKISLRSNVAGYILKPFVIWPSGNFRAFKHIDHHKHECPLGAIGSHE